MAYDFSENRKITNEQLESQIAEISPLNKEQIDKLLPKKADKERLERLINIVNSSTTQQKKLAALKDNIDDVGGVLLKILGKLL